MTDSKATSHGTLTADQGGGGYALCECGYEHSPNCGKAVER